MKNNIYDLVLALMLLALVASGARPQVTVPAPIEALFGNAEVVAIQEAGPTFP